MYSRQVYFHSPFTLATVTEKNNPVLLLLFILQELARYPEGLVDGKLGLFPPFDWAFKHPPAQKMREHLLLLPAAFPALAHLVPTLYQNLDKSAPELTALLEPFILTHQTDENLLLFLVRHQKPLAVKPLLDRICPQGLDVLKEKIAHRFRKRGYPFTRWTHLSKTP